MPNYDWRDFQNTPWDSRFPAWAEGFDDWGAFSTALPTRVLPMAARAQPLPRPSCPRVFISHRQSDVAKALRVAWLADQAGFEYWLDVLDPNLQALSQSHGNVNLTPTQEAIAIASIIEMALLNSTHVLAVMTKATIGSQWVPYEYGRAKDLKPLTFQAACWVQPKLAVPEYMLLGVVNHSETDLGGWLQSEAANWPGQGPCGHSWSGVPVPDPLDVGTSTNDTPRDIP